MPLPALAVMGIGAGIGAVASGLSTLFGSSKEQKKIRQQQQMAQKAYEYERAHSQGMYNLQQGEALKSLSIQKNRLAQAYHADIEGFNLGLQGQGLQNQAARVSLEDSTGMALAQQGASGTRGSDALQQRIDFQENQFNRQLDLQGRGNVLALQNMGQQYSNQFSDIGREIDSWHSGGYRHKAKSLSDVYAAQMHDLKMQGFDQAASNAKPTGLDFLAAGLSGAAQGAGVGSMVGDLLDQWPVKTQTKNIYDSSLTGKRW